MQKEIRTGHTVTTRSVQNKLGSSEVSLVTGVKICKARHMNENMQNKGNTVIVVGGEDHRWHPWNEDHRKPHTDKTRGVRLDGQGPR